MTITDFNQKQRMAEKSIISGELAQKITDGDKSVEGQFVEINYRWLLFMVRRKFNRSNNHEDIVQDTFMLVLTKLKQGSVNNPKAILGFLRTAAIQIGYDYLRKDKKFTSDIDPSLMDTFKDDTEEILSKLIWKDKLRFVKKMVDELKIQRDKDILIKFYIKDEDKKSICEDLELSSIHFDRVIFRAKERLKNLIDAQKNNNKPNNDKTKYTSSNGQLKSIKNKKDDKKSNNSNEKGNMSKIYHYVIAALQKYIKPVVRKIA